MKAPSNPSLAGRVILSPWSTSSSLSSIGSHVSSVWSRYQSAATPSRYPPTMSIHRPSLQLLAAAYLLKVFIHCFGSSLSFPEKGFGRTKVPSLFPPTFILVSVFMNSANCSRFMTSSSSSSSNILSGLLCGEGEVSGRLVSLLPLGSFGDGVLSLGSALNPVISCASSVYETISSPLIIGEVNCLRKGVARVG